MPAMAFAAAGSGVGSGGDSGTVAAGAPEASGGWSMAATASFAEASGYGYGQGLGHGLVSGQLSDQAAGDAWVRAAEAHFAAVAPPGAYGTAVSASITTTTSSSSSGGGGGSSSGVGGSLGGPAGSAVAAMDAHAARLAEEGDFEEQMLKAYAAVNANADPLPANFKVCKMSNAPRPPQTVQPLICFEPSGLCLLFTILIVRGADAGVLASSHCHGTLMFALVCVCVCVL